MLLVSDAWALDPHTRLSQYGVLQLTSDHGLPQNAARALAQTRDGYLWIATEEGLARFDGVRFTVYSHTRHAAFGSDLVNALAADDSDRIWAGTPEGLVRSAAAYKDWQAQTGIDGTSVTAIRPDATGGLWVGTAGGTVQRWPGRGESPPSTYVSARGRADDRVTALQPASDGSMWVATFGSGVRRVGAGGAALLIPPASLPDPRVMALSPTADGGMWIGSYQDGLSRWLNGSLRRYGPAEGLPHDGVWTLLQDGDGNLWVGTPSHGLIRFADGRFETFPPDNPLATTHVISLFEDRERNLWVGTAGDGLFRLRDVPITSYGKPEGLGDDMVWTLYEHRPGEVWIGTRAGLHRFDGRRFHPVTTADGLHGNSTYAVTGDPTTGAIFVVQKGGGLSRRVGGRFEPVKAAGALRDLGMVAMFRDSRSRLWLGTLRSDKVHYLEDGELHALGRAEGFVGNAAMTFAEDAAGAIWIGTRTGGLFRYHNQHFQHWTTANGLSSDHIVTIHPDSNGAVWIGTLGGGLNRMSGDRITVYTAAQGLPSDKVFQILEDDDGRLWMCSNQGLFWVSKDVLNAFADGRTQTIVANRYGRADGMRSTECNGSSQPAGWKGADGRLWFPTVKGVVVVDTRRLRENKLSPPVHVEEVFVNGERLDRIPEDGLPPPPNRFEVRFTALSLQAPEKMRLRYRLDGFDQDWTPSGPDRMASYTNLRGGEYRFRVIASNNDGVWNEQGASLSFRVRPNFYQTIPFYIAVGAFVVLTGFIIHRLRMAPVRAHIAVLLERTRIARELHDTLAQSLVAIKVQLDVISALVEQAPSKAQTNIERAQQLVRTGLEEARYAVWSLRGDPLTENDFAAAAQNMVEKLTAQAPFTTRFLHDGTTVTLDPEAHYQVLRMLREAVINVVRHAQASQLTVRINTAPDEVTILVQDNGQGFTPTKLSDSFGLVGIRERAHKVGATVAIRSAPGSGAEVDMRLGLPRVARAPK